MRSTDKELLEYFGFYKEGESRSKGFSKQGSGTINIDRALNNKPDYWFGPKLKKIPKDLKKVLITHPIANSNILMFYVRLWSMGCKLYVWEGEPILCHTLVKLEAHLKKAEPCEETLSDFKKLDYFETLKLMLAFDNPSMKGRFLHPIDFSDFLPEHQAYLSLLTKEENPIDALFGFDVLDPADYFSPKGFANLKKITFIKDKTLFTSVGTLSTLCPQLEELSLKNFQDDPLDNISIEKIRIFENLKSLNLRGSNINSLQLEALLLRCPNLETLDLQSCKELINDFIDVFQKSQFHLSKLKSLNLKGDLFNVTQLEILLSQCPNLEDLNAEGCQLAWKSFSNVFNEDPPRLPKLKSLKLKLTSIDAEKRDLLLRHSPNLESLSLFYYKNRGNDFDLTKLKSLDFNGSYIEINDLEVWLKRFPNVESLNLGLCPYFMGIIFNAFGEESSRLVKLKSLFLNHTSINPEQLKSLIIACPNLESLDLASCGKLREDELSKAFKDSPARLLSLKSVNLKESPISASLLETLIKSCPNLESLDLTSSLGLNGRQDYSENFKASHSSLPKLKSLTLTQSSIRTNNLEVLLWQSPNVELLNLSNCQYLGEGFSNTFREGHSRLPKLKSLILDQSRLSGAELCALLRQCVALESLEFSHSKDLKNEISFALRLDKLKMLTLQGSDTNMTYLGALLRQCPKLEKLDLSSSDGLENGSFGTHKIGAPFLGKLKSLQLQGSSINATQLAALLLECSDLELLYLSHCKNLQNGFLHALRDSPSSLLNLKSIDLSFIKLSITRLLILLQKCPNLEVLKLEGLEGISFEEIQALRIKWPHCIIFPTQASVSSTKNMGSSEYQPKSDSISGNIDIDTNLRGDETCSVNQYFQGSLAKDYSHYRLDVEIGSYSSFKNEIKIITAETTNNARKLHESTPGSHYGSRIIINHTWQKLPSLTPYDSNPTLQCDVPLELGFNKANGLYYIRVKNSEGDYPLEFVIKEGQTHKNINKGALDSKIKTKILSHLKFTQSRKLDAKASYSALEFLNSFSPDKKLMLLSRFFNKFKPGPLEGVHQGSLYHERINAIIKNRKGSCRHRAMAFFEICNALGFEVRLIQNDCHAFCEVFSEEKWQTIELGGYPAKLKIKDLTKQNKIDSTQQINQGGIVPSVSSAAKPKATEAGASEEALVVLTEEGTSEPEKSLFPELLKSCPAEIGNNMAYAKWIAQQADTQLLISYQNKQEVDAVVDSLRANARPKNSTFYLDNLDDASYQDLVANDGNHDIKESHLIRFLETAKRGDTLIIHREKFETGHIGYNTMLVKDRKIGQHKIPDDVNIITLIPHSSRLSYGPDFYSRFSFKTELQKAWLPIPKIPEKTGENEAEIHLYGNDCWQAKTVGKPSFSEKGISYVTGELTKALAKECTEITFVNPPDSREFNVFFRQLKNAREYFSNGTLHSIPDEVCFYIKNSEYSLGKKDISFEPIQEKTPAKWDVLLNPATFNDFFDLHTSRKTESAALGSASVCNLLDVPGFLGQYKNKTLRVLLNSDLRPGEWAQLCDKAEEFKCHLVAIDVTQTAFTAQEKSSDFSGTKDPVVKIHPEHSIIITDNHDAIVHQLYREQSNVDVLCLDPETEVNVVVLCVGLETEVSDLLGHMNFEKINGKTLSFPIQEGALITLLKAKKNVVLRGNLSFACESALASLFSSEPHLIVNGERFFPESSVSIVSENESTLNFLPNRSYISGSTPIDKSAASSLPRVSSDQNKSPIENAELFDQERLAKVTEALKTEPGLFLVGPTAAGKSTFVSKKLFKEKGVIGYTGLEQLKAFASDKNPGLKILMIDEANLLEPSLLTRFEGLFSPTPGILIDETWYPLTSEHKVIFAGNPPDYKGRTVHPLWERYLKFETFNALPFWYIKERVNDPLCQKIDLSLNDQILKDIEKNPDLTPRDIQQKLFSLRVPKQNLDWESLKAALQKQDFTVTKSRELALQSLLQHLDIRDLKIQKSHMGLQDQGINACILEGDAGIGKSVMAEALLKSPGFVPGDLKESDSRDKIYYYISASDLQDFNAIMKKAFHEGAVLIIDELNAFPNDVERDLNIFLSGTDLENNPPNKAGFFVIGTQNPVISKAMGIEYGGREEASKALANRCDKIYLPSYNHAELSELLCAQGYEKNFATRFALDFLRALNEAIDTNALVIPTPRDFFTLADKPSENILSFKLFIALEKYLTQSEGFENQFGEILALLDKGANPSLLIHKGMSCHTLLKQVFIHNSAAQEMAIFCLANSKEIPESLLNFYSKDDKLGILELLNRAYSRAQEALGPGNRKKLEDSIKLKLSALGQIFQGEIPKTRTSSKASSASMNSRSTFFQKLFKKPQDKQAKTESSLRK